MSISPALTQFCTTGITVGTVHALNRAGSCLVL